MSNENQVHSQGLYVPCGEGTKFVYMTSFVEDEPMIGAIVVAVNAEDAEKIILNHLYMIDYPLCEYHSRECNKLELEVFCQADDSQLGKVQLLRRPT